MKKNISLLLTSVVFFMAADATEWRAEDRCCMDKSNLYAKIFGGANFLQDTTTNGNKATYEAGYIVSGSGGYCWRYGLRFEGEYAYRRNDISKIHFVTQGSSTDGHFQTSSYMANLLWDMPLCSWGCSFWNIQPFIGAGIGADLQEMHSSNSRIEFYQNWTHFSWQAMAGLAFPIFRHTELTLEYKFHQGGSHFYNNSVGFALVYKFGYFKKCQNQAQSSEKTQKASGSARVP